MNCNRFVMALGMAALVGSAAAQGAAYQLHTVFMYSFTRYVQWPEEKNTGDFRILVVGDSPITAELRKMAEQKKVGTRTIRVEEAARISGNETSHIIFIASEKSAMLADALAKLPAKGILIVTEQEGLGAKGSAINFVMKDGKLAFELNQAAMGRQGLKASSELIRLAVVI
jgi:hypothetical protein